MPNIDNLKKFKNVHMIGIGGVSMSGIAAILKNWGFNITGSDWSKSENTEKLEEQGIHVTIGHDLNSVSKADVVVYSAAIKEDDPEMIEAHKDNRLGLTYYTRLFLMSYFREAASEEGHKKAGHGIAENYASINQVLKNLYDDTEKKASDD